MRRIHIFKPGTHTDSSGATLTFSQADLTACASAYNPALHEAPLVAGHPRHDLPAYGWVERLEVDEDGLHAIPTQVEAAFEEIVEEGRYKHVSASFYLPDSPANPTPGTLHLRHVGFLGAQPPAVKGLRQIEFNEAEAGVANFDEALPLGAVARIFRGIRDWFIGREGVEVADRVVSQWDVEELEGASRRQMEANLERAGVRFDEGTAAATAEAPIPDAQAPDAPEAPIPDAPVPDAPAADVEAPAAPVVDEAAERLAEIERREADLAAREQEAAAALAERLAGEETAARRREQEAAATALMRPATEFAERLETAGQILPREREAVAETLAALAATGATVQFGEGDAAETVDVAATMRGLLSRLPVQVDYAERGATPSDGPATADFAAPSGFTVDPGRAALHNRALDYQSSHPGTSYIDAVKAVS